MARKAKTEQKQAKAKVEKPPRGQDQETHVALPTPEDFNRAFDRIKSAERKNEKARAEAKEITTSSKAGLNKAYADAAAMLDGRKLSIRSLKRLYVLSNRDEDELTAEITGETWAMRALGFQVGTQLALFPDGVKDAKDGLVKAKRDGRDAGARGINSTENPHAPGSAPGQAWLAGWSEAQASITPSNVTELRRDADEDDDEGETPRRHAAE